VPNSANPNCKMNPLSVFIRCNICASPSAAAAAADPQETRQVVNVQLLSCKHLACDPCLSKLRDSNGRTYCPFCKNPVRCIRIDGRDKLPSNIKALFGNPVDLLKQAIEAWEYQTGHADMFFRVTDKDFRRVREDGQAEVNGKLQKNMQLEAAVAAVEQRNHELSERIKAMQKDLEKASSVPQAYRPMGTVKSP